MHSSALRVWTSSIQVVLYASIGLLGLSYKTKNGKNDTKSQTIKSSTHLKYLKTSAADV